MNTYKNNFYPKKVKWKRATLKKKSKESYQACVYDDHTSIYSSLKT